MTTIQQVLFEMESDYLGHPYFVTGHALFNALARRVDARTRRALNVSHGVFVPGEYGAYPESHSHDGYAGKLGMSLPPVEAYEDLFVFRDAAHRWLLDSRPRDAHNTHDIQSHGGRLAFSPVTHFGRPPEHRNSKRTMHWYVHCYLYADGGDEAVLPLSEDVLDGLRVGGARNYGLGELSLAETQVIDLTGLDYSRVREASSLQIELLSPYVLASDYPEADSQSVPWWWESDEQLRRRTTRLVAGDDVHAMATVDHGQVVAYAGDRPVETAKNGIRRVGTHAKYGFGELRLRPADAGRVPERAQASEERTAGES
ncbi:hypothetical protein [Halosolutus gelatinilyticus]|uniref:hypothetical protein n=1 Tax=Halosolutus gelatinilyticus TaxID=2931975 RepID=UPI001FF2FF96|nr:hypothetical protein [Halosolutus gelatinilyticus]